ncbi:hypothetical protein M8C21_007174, partial [Ambrosia artemisiifolia]
DNKKTRLGYRKSRLSKFWSESVIRSVTSRRILVDFDDLKATTVEKSSILNYTKADCDGLLTRFWIPLCKITPEGIRISASNQEHESQDQLPSSLGDIYDMFK